MIQRLTLIGAGLIGGSFALALRAAFPGLQVTLFDHNAEHAAQAVAQGLGQRAATSLADAVLHADLVMLAVPVGALPALFADLAPLLDAHTVLTDVGSTKADVLAAAAAALGAALPRFVPGHPISGAERSGPGAAQAGLYRGRRVVLCPSDVTDPSAIALVQSLWERTGAEVHVLTAAQHDAVFAAVSHLPHLLSFALVDALAARDNGALLFSYAAGGFRDFTRIAASHPAMWRDIALANRDALLAELDAYQAALARLRAQVAEGNAVELEATFQRARAARVRWGQEHS